MKGKLTRGGDVRGWVHSQMGADQSTPINNNVEGTLGAGGTSKSRYHNPDPLAQLIGPTNETEIILEGVNMKALIETGANMSCVNKWLVEKLQLPVQSLQTILNIEGTGGVRVPYYGIVECQLGLPEVKGFQKDVLMLVIDDSPYRKKVPVQLGTLHIDMILKAAEQSPTARLGDSWE